MYYLRFVILLIAEADIILKYPEGIIYTVRLPEWSGVGVFKYILVVDYDFEPIVFFKVFHDGKEGFIFEADESLFPAVGVEIGHLRNLQPSVL